MDFRIGILVNTVKNEQNTYIYLYCGPCIDGCPFELGFVNEFSLRQMNSVRNARISILEDDG